MKKVITIVGVIIIVLGLAGYAVWHFGTNLASEKVMEKVEAKLNDENLEEVKSYIESDPKVQEMVNEAKATNPDTLPFQTKEEATRVLIKKVGVNSLLDIKNKAESGTINKNEVLAELEGKLSEEEISALKYVLYKELYKEN